MTWLNHVCDFTFSQSIHNMMCLLWCGATIQHHTHTHVKCGCEVRCPINTLPLDVSIRLCTIASKLFSAKCRAILATRTLHSSSCKCITDYCIYIANNVERTRIRPLVSTVLMSQDFGMPKCCHRVRGVLCTWILDNCFYFWTVKPCSDLFGMGDRAVTSCDKCPFDK